jgi:hypothetical protein
MPNDWHRNPFEPRSGSDVRIAFADQNSDRRTVIDRNVLLNGTAAGSHCQLLRTILAPCLSVIFAVGQRRHAAR